MYGGMNDRGGGKMEWIELDMTGKPLEEVIEYEVRLLFCATT